MRVRRLPDAVRGAAIACCAAALALGVSACGGGERQDENEQSGTFSVDVTEIDFPQLQGLAETVPFRATVRNTGDETIDNIAMTLEGFGFRQAQPGDADPQRPLWIVNNGPVDGTTAYVDTWTLGPLKAGEEKRFIWSVTAVVPGTHTLNYRVAAGLDAKAKAVTADDQIPEGSVTVRVTRRPREATVDPKTGEVVHKGE